MYYTLHIERIKWNISSLIICFSIILLLRFVKIISFSTRKAVILIAK